MKTVADLLRVERAYLQIVVETGDHDAVAEVQKVVGPAFADAREFAARQESILANRNLSPSGRAAELAKLAEQRESVGSQHDATLSEAIADTETRDRHTREAADRGMEPYKGGWVLKDHTSNDPVQAALDGEARGELRKIPKDVFSGKYRGWVVEDRRLARIAELDPLEELVSPNDRRWAREWRIAHSELAPKLKVLEAQLRTYTLVLETLRMEFRARFSVGAHAQ